MRKASKVWSIPLFGLPLPADLGGLPGVMLCSRKPGLTCANLC
jgi:hypothetical protein